MNVEQITLHNILSHADSAVAFTHERLWLICGENGAGKSAFFDGLEYALYGRHRGGGDDGRDGAHSQQAELLVKHGETSARIEVVLRLGTARYRVTRHLDVREGNKGGDVVQLHDDGREELIPARGRGGAWDWLRQHGLPPYELFRSAIYLRQGHAAHFLRGSAADRINRFATLIDLSQYSELSRAAKRRKDDAFRERERLTGARLELGNVSDEALVFLDDELRQLSAAIDAAETQLRAAKAVREGAEEVQRLEEQRQGLMSRRQALAALLADADVIRADHALVRAWDQAAGPLLRFWEAHARADSAHAEAAGQKQAAAADTVELIGTEAALMEYAERRDRYAQTLLPEAERRANAARQRVSHLTLETEIARARFEMVAAENMQVVHDGGDALLEECQNCAGELHWLRTLAERRANAEQAEADLPACELAAAAGEDAARAAEQALTLANASVEIERAAADAAAAAFRAQENRLTSLEGRISSHEGLNGAERECPVCAQPLTEQAHAHLRSTLSAELAEQSTLREELVALKLAQTGAEATLGVAVAEQSAARQAHQRCESERNIGKQRLQIATDVRDKAREALAVALADVTQHCPHYDDLLDRVTLTWCAEERERLDGDLDAMRERVRGLRAAEQALHAARARLETLRSRRSDGAEPLGDTQQADAMAAALREATAAVEQADEDTDELRAALEEERGFCETMQRSIAGLKAQLAAAERQALEAQARAETEEAGAAGIRAGLGEIWAAELMDRAAFERGKQEAEERRASATRFEELLQAGGGLSEVERDLEANAVALSAADPLHRVPVEAARMAEAATNEKTMGVKLDHGQKQAARENFEERRAKAREYGRQIDAAATSVQTFGLLEDLLAEGGPIQTGIVEEMQAQIAHEVNIVLEKLTDGLRVRLGEARRARAVQLKDLVFVDEHDPNGRPRHYEFLSGGEQFRVALALALALHRRVGREPGTIIVDEGFGALDGNRRDALAHQMTDASQGLLSLGLAQSVIICSHNEDVQQRFPHRWFVRKPGGTALVEEQNDENDVA